jgi:hypothetical protein
VFEQILEKVPELRKLEETIASLEQEHQRAQAKVAALANKVSQAREHDLNAEAQALNRGHRVPAPREPKLREQLEATERDLEILLRRRALAEGERSRFVAENSERLAALLSGARAAEAAKVSAGANEVLQWLLDLFKAEDDLRSLQRLHPAPVEENTDGPQGHTVVFGPLTRVTTDGPRRGDLEGTLRYLVSLGPTTEVGEVEDEAGAA